MRLKNIFHQRGKPVRSKLQDHQHHEKNLWKDQNIYLSIQIQNRRFEVGKFKVQERK